MRKWLTIGLALLAFSGSMAGIFLNLAIVASEMPLGHNKYLWMHAADVSGYAALGVQLIGVCVTWRGFRVRPSKYQRMLRCAAVVAGCDIASFLIALKLFNNSAWAWAVVRALA